MDASDNGRLESVAGLSAAQIRGLSDDEFLRLMHPLMIKFAHRSYIPGYEFDDKMQELAIVLLRCKKQYAPDDPSKLGHGGKPSGFMNYTIRAVRNFLGKLDEAGKRGSFVASHMECKACGNVVIARRKDTCSFCSGRRWQLVRVSPASVDALKEALVPWEPMSMDDYPIEIEDLVDRVLALLPAAQRDSAVGYFYGHASLTAPLRRSITEAIISHPGILMGGPFDAIRNDADVEGREHSERCLQVDSAEV
jgi:ribosomal protein L37E